MSPRKDTHALDTNEKSLLNRMVIYRDQEGVFP